MKWDCIKAAGILIGSLAVLFSSIQWTVQGIKQRQRDAREARAKEIQDKRDEIRAHVIETRESLCRSI